MGVAPHGLTRVQPCTQHTTLPMRTAHHSRPHQVEGLALALLAALPLGVKVLQLWGYSARSAGVKRPGVVRRAGAESVRGHDGQQQRPWTSQEGSKAALGPAGGTHLLHHGLEALQLLHQRRLLLLGLWGRRLVRCKVGQVEGCGSACGASMGTPPCSSLPATHACTHAHGPPVPTCFSCATSGADCACCMLNSA